MRDTLTSNVLAASVLCRPDSCRTQATKRRIGAWVAVMFLAVFSLEATAQRLLPDWYQQSPVSSPPQRYIQAMTYDAGHRQTVLFGGFGNGYLNDTWLWDGSNWTVGRPTTVPPPRAAPAMAYDAAHGQVVLFGGFINASGRLSDTWLWDGTNWTAATPAASPSPRSNMVMVYDAARGQVVLFGGFDGSDLGETWVWDGTNWTNVSPAPPAQSPSPRDDYGMAYDAALGEVILFGGSSSGVNLNDTWAWNGTTWTPLSVSTSPAARDGQGMIYDAATSQVMLFGGSTSTDSSTFLSDTWTFNGANWTQLSVNAPPARIIPNGVAYDSFRQQAVMFGGLASTQLGDTWQFGLPGDFGNVNVCPGGTTSPAGCGSTIAFSYNFANGATLGTPRVVTQGTTGLDFSLVAGASTCSGTVSPGNCTVSVTFTPVRPGTRAGAIQLLDTGGNVLQTTPIYGVGLAPEVSFGLPSINTLATGSFALSQPKGVAVDAAGTVYVGDSGNQRVVKIAANGLASTVGVGLGSPQGVAIDGAGTVYVADSAQNVVHTIPAGCSTTACQGTLGVGLATGVAVDGAGDVFVATFNNHQVVEFPIGCTITSCVAVVYGGGTASQPAGVAVDAAGDVFIADSGLAKVIEVPAGCTTSACQVALGSGWSRPAGVAVDAAGDLYVADQGLQKLVELPFGCTSVNCEQVIAINASSVAVDAQGVAYTPELTNSQVLLVAQTPTGITFNTTNVGGTSSDSPKSIPFRNIGNQPLLSRGAGVTVPGPDFLQVAGPRILPDCLYSFSINPGQACDLAISFTPQSPSTQLQGSASLTDNALNAASVSQTATFQGAGVAITNLALTVTETGSGSGTVFDNFQQIECVQTNGISTGACAGSYPGGTQVTLTESPGSASTFVGWGGACASFGVLPSCTVTLTQAANATAAFGSQSFGNVNVCPAGQTAPAPCSVTSPITFDIATTASVGSIRVVTQGTPGLDFTPGTASTCTGTIAGGSTCSVSVRFAPIAPGIRLGAVQLYDNGGNLLASTPLSGVGLEPQIAFGPGAQTTIVTGLNSPSGVATDSAGDVFVAVSGNNQVLKIGPDGTSTSLGSGFNQVSGVAVDGAGNVIIAQFSVLLIPPGCTVPSCRTTLAQGVTGGATGVATDGAGDIFVSYLNPGKVIEIPPGCTTAACTTTVWAAPAGVASQPEGIAVNAAGDLFIADGSLVQVLKVPAGCTAANCQVKIGQGWIAPTGVALDAAGDVFVSDANLAAITEVPVGCTTSGCQLRIVSVPAPFGVAVDPLGNVIAPSITGGQVLRVNRTQPPALSFALTNAGSTSTDSPKPVIVQNGGNQSLTGSLSLALGAGFRQITTLDCAAAFPLAPGAVCNETFNFNPPAATYFSGTATFTDNTLNANALSQVVTLTGTGATNGLAGTVAVPNVVGQPQTAATTPIAGVGLTLGTVTSASSNTVPAGNVVSESPGAGTQVTVGSAVNLLVSTGTPQPPPPNPLSINNNYFVTGDYVSAGVTLRGLGVNGKATRSITIPSYAQSATEGVPDGADVVDAFLYWETIESTPLASSTSGTFNGYSIVGQQIGSDQPGFRDGTLTGTIRSYRASVNAYLPVGANGIRIASGTYSVSLPDGGGSALPLTEGASLVMIYRVLSPNFPLKSVVLYDGAIVPAGSAVQVVKGFYDAAGGANGTGKNTNLFASGGIWNDSVNSVALGASNQYTATLNPGSAYAAVMISTPVNNSDHDGILDAWKAGPPGGDFHAGQPGYYDIQTGSWVGLPGAKHGQKDLFVQLDYMCGALLADGSCDPTKENLFPAPDASGNDPLAMVKQAFLNSGVQLHLQVDNAVPESTCLDDLSTTPTTLCQFPGQPGVIGWKNSLQFSKLYPRNLQACLAGTDCTTRFPFGQKDSYHYVLFGHSLAIPAWNSRFGSLTSIKVANGVTTIGTIDRGTGLNACPARITLAGVLGDPALNGVYNTTGCSDTMTITVSTPGVPNYTYPNSILPEPVIGLTSGTITSISGYSDLGGADSAVTLGLWLTAPNQDMSKRSNVLAGTLFHEIGHTLGLSHGGLYYDTPGSYVPTFEGNCKPNYQSVMNYLFQLDLVGPNQSIALSNQTLATLNESTASATTQLRDVGGVAATFPTSAWYVPYTTGSTVSPATRHCDGTPLTGDQAYRVDASIAPVTPPWTNGQDLNFIGNLQTSERGFNDLANMDLRQVGATSGGFVALSNLLYFGSPVAPLNIGAGGSVTLGSGGSVALGSGGSVTLGSGGNVTLGSAGTITLGSGGSVTLGSGGNVTLGSGGTVTPGASGSVTLGSGGSVTLGSGGTITLGGGGSVTLGTGGTVTLGSGGSVTLGSGGTPITVAAGGSVTLGSGGSVTLGSGGSVTLGSGGSVTLGSGGSIALGSGGSVTLGSGGSVTLGSGGSVTLGSGGSVTLGSGGNVTLGSGGSITLGSGGSVTLGSGGSVTLGSGGSVTLGSGGALGSGGSVTLGSGGSATLGAGGSVTLGSGGSVTLGSGGSVTLGSGGTVILEAGGSPMPVAAGGSVTLGSGGSVTLGSGGSVTLGSGGSVTLGSGGVVILGPGGSVNLGSGTGIGLSSVTNLTPGSGGPLSANELTYETANSIVRPPYSPTETSTPAGVRINWTAPAFGVVQTYTIYRSSNGATPTQIGSVSGINGFPPATEFTDTNPDVLSKTVVYTVTTTLVPDANGPSRQSLPSVEAVLKNDQSIVLGPVPSSVTIGNPPSITATSLSGGVPSGLQVIFTSAGTCSIGSQFLSNNVSSAAILLNSTGTCTITASQPGTTSFNAANTVSGTFMILPQGSGTKSQVITFAPLQNVQYGGSFALNASSSSGIPVSFTPSGPCTIGGKTTGAGVCTIIASAPSNGTYSAASLTQSFRIDPAVLSVAANSLSSAAGQSIPPLTYVYSGFVNSDAPSVISGAPALSTTATSTSAPGMYPITVSTGTLASANYAFLYVDGTLTLQSTKAPLTLIATSPLTFGQSETLSVTGSSPGAIITYNLVTGPCTHAGAQLTAASGTGVCQVSATMAGAGGSGPVTSAPVNVTLALATQTITFTTNPPATAAFNSSFTVAATATSGVAVTFSSAGACNNLGSTYTMTNSTGTCSVIASQAGSTNYSSIQTTRMVTASGPLLTVSPSAIDFGTVYLASITTRTITITNTGTAPATISDPILSLVRGGNSNEFIALNLCPRPLAAGKACRTTIAFVAGPFYTPQTATLQVVSNAPGSPQPVALSAVVIAPLAKFNPVSLSFATIKHATSSTMTVTLSNPGQTPLIFNGAGISITGVNATSFAQTSACGSSLAAKASCAIAVKFNPATIGTFNANLTVVDNALGGGTQSIPLTGKGN